MKIGINKAKPTRAFKQLGTALLCAGSLALLGVMPQQTIAAARAWSNGVGTADFASALYKKEYIDMQVKVRGRMLNIKRRWQDDHWTMLPDIGDLTFVYEQVYVEAKKNVIGVTGTGAASGGAAVLTGVEPQTVDGELITIKRGDYKYNKVAGGTDGDIIFRFESDDKVNTKGFISRKIITKTADGHTWSDGKGNKMAYDTAGKIQYMEDANGNKITMERDAQGRIGTIKDPVDATVLTIEYIAIDSDKILSVEDYTGRKIEYVWDGDKIKRVKDVRGEYTDYGYSHYDIKEGMDVLSSEKDPMDRVTTINYKLDPGGMICVPKTVDPGERVTYTQNAGGGTGGTTYAVMGCEYQITVPKNLTMRGITLPGEAAPSKTYDYFYDANKKLYYNKVIHADGMVEERAINLNGETVAKYINDVKISKITRDGNKYISENQQGLKTTKEYDQWRNLTKITYPDNNSKSFKYNNIGKILQKTNEEGTITKYEYDTVGNLHKRIDALGTADERTVEWCNQYTELDDCNTLKTANCGGVPTNRCSVVKYHGGVINGITIPDSIKVAIVDDKDNIEKAIDAEGHQTQYDEFDALGNAKKTTDAATKEWTATYDNAGNQLTSITPKGHEVKYDYNKAGDIETVTDPVANTGQNTFDVKFHYNAKGQVFKVEDSEGDFTETKFDSRGRTVEKKDAEGQITKTIYDTFGRKSQVEDASGNKIIFNYKTDGTIPYRRAESIEYPTFSRHFKYDNRGRVEKVYNKIEEDEMLLIADIKYSKTGQRVSVTDANGKETQYFYDKLGRVLKHIDADLKETNYVYDYTGNLLSIEDPESSKTQYSYDKDGRKVKETRPMLGEYTYNYTYNDRGMLETFIDPKGNKTTYKYDDDGSLDIQKNFAQSDLANPVRELDLDYYANGNLQGYSDGTISSSYTYDDSGALLSETINYPGFTKSYSYTYYKNGAKKTYTDAENATYEYGYNESGQLQSLKIPGVGNYSISSYKFMSPETELLPGGTKRTYDYTAQMQLKGIAITDPAQNPIMNYQYTYDDVGNIDTKTTEHGLYDYDYDNLYRLTNAVNPNTATEVFTYDTVGNRLTTQESAEEWTYNANHELQTKPQYGYSYDDNGSIDKITKDSQDTHFIYNEANRLTEVKNHANATVARYQYDPFGRRISKEVSGVKTYFMYTDRGLAAEYTATGQLIRGYGYKPYGHWTTDPLYQKTGGKYYFYQNDHLGTPQKLTGTNGAIVWDARYESFGRAYIQSNVIDNPLRFAGQYHDQETNIYYNWNRYYSPELGRYITSDPIGLKGGLNTFAYAGGNPVRAIDPEGLSWFSGKGYSSEKIDGVETVKVDDCAVVVFYGHGIVSTSVGWKSPKVRQASRVPPVVTGNRNNEGGYCSAAEVIGCNTGRYVNVENEVPEALNPTESFHNLYGYDDPKTGKHMTARQIIDEAKERAKNTAKQLCQEKKCKDSCTEVSIYYDDRSGILFDSNDKIGQVDCSSLEFSD